MTRDSWLVRSKRNETKQINSTHVVNLVNLPIISKIINDKPRLRGPESLGKAGIQFQGVVRFLGKPAGSAYDDNYLISQALGENKTTNRKQLKATEK